MKSKKKNYLVFYKYVLKRPNVDFEVHEEKPLYRIEFLVTYLLIPILLRRCLSASQRILYFLVGIIINASTTMQSFSIFNTTRRVHLATVAGDKKFTKKFSPAVITCLAYLRNAFKAFDVLFSLIFFRLDCFCNSFLLRCSSTSFKNYTTHYYFYRLL